MLWSHCGELNHYAVVTLWRFSWRFIPIGVIVMTGMIGTVSGMKTPESGMKTPENRMVGDSRRGTGSGGDCFKMFKTIGVNRRESRIMSLLDGSPTQS